MKFSQAILMQCPPNHEFQVHHLDCFSAFVSRFLSFSKCNFGFWSQSSFRKFQNLVWVNFDWLRSLTKVFCFFFLPRTGPDRLQLKSTCHKPDSVWTLFGVFPADNQFPAFATFHHQTHPNCANFLSFSFLSSPSPLKTLANVLALFSQTDELVSKSTRRHWKAMPSPCSAYLHRHFRCVLVRFEAIRLFLLKQTNAIKRILWSPLPRLTKSKQSGWDPHKFPDKYNFRRFALPMTTRSGPFDQHDTFFYG